MAVVLTYSIGVPVVKVGRIAGQFAKPRSAATERVGDVDLPSFRGHIVNDSPFDAAARMPDPDRLVQAYHQSASTLNLLRAFTKGGFADLARVHAWTQEFVASSPEGRRYEQLAGEIDRALRFMRACGIDTEVNPNLREVDVYTSHEALHPRLRGGAHPAGLADRRAGTTARPTCCGSASAPATSTAPTSSSSAASATRSAARSARPIDGRRRCSRCASALNPARIPGRLTLISRMGADHVEDAAAAAAARRHRRRPSGRVGVRPDARQHVHARRTAARPATSTTSCGEIAGFVRAHRAEGTWPGGIHVELTGENVTECLGGADEVSRRRPRRPLRDDVRPTAQRPPERSTSPSGSPS